VLTRDDVAKVLAPIAAAYTNWHPTKDTYTAYHFILADVDVEALKVAVWRSLADDRAFAPSPGELRSLALDAIEQATGSAVPDAFQAWSSVTRAFIDVGATGTPSFDNLTAEAVRRIGGWRSLCASENQVADRARFLEAYQSLHGRAVEMLRLPVKVQQQYAALARRLSSPAIGGPDARPHLAPPSAE